MKALLFAMLAALLIGCGASGSGDSGGDSSNTNLISIFGVGGVRTVSEDEKFDLSISGTGNEVTVAPGSKIGELDVSGVDQIVTIGIGSTIDSIELSGVGNSIFVPVGTTYDLDESGVGNTITEF